MNYWHYLKKDYNESIPVLTFFLFILSVVCFMYPSEKNINLIPTLVGIPILGILGRSFIKYITQGKDWFDN